MPRYLLIESALEARRVLEVGTTDPRSLLRLLDAGAARVIGTAPDASVFDRSRFSSHEIELFSMDRGRVDFPDDSFDAVLVVDLALELTHNKRFLDEVRRVLSPDGFVLVGFSATGRSLLHLVTDDPTLPELEPGRLEAAVRDAFPDARFYVQSPFIGVAIHREGEDPAGLDVSLDPTLAGQEARPSHVLALAGAGSPEANDRTLVELPFLDFEALTEASQAKSATDVKRLLGALAEARRAIGERDKSLSEIGSRLPRIKAAVQERLRRAQSSTPPRPDVISPTVLERPTDEGTPRLTEAVGRLESAREDLRTRVDGLSAALDREREARAQAEARAEEVESHAARLERMLREANAEAEATSEHPHDAPEQRQLEAMHHELEQKDHQIQDFRTTVDRYETRISELQQTIVEQVTVRPEPLVEDVSIEAERRIQLLERTTSAQEQEIESLRYELTSQLEVRHSMGSDYRDSESRLVFLSGRIDELTIAHAAEKDHLEQRVAFLAQALSESDHQREHFKDRLDQFEHEESDVESARRAAHERAAEAVAAYEESSLVARGLADEVDRLRRDAHQRAGRIEALERELLDRTAEMQAVSGSAQARDADRRAVEMAAGHLSREVETLRSRVQELRNERDTLAATSSLLLEERDAAATLARGAIDSENRARQLSESLEGGQAAIERLERELETAHESAEKAHRAHLDLSERNKRLEGELHALRSKIEAAQNDDSASRSRASDLDQKLASLERRLTESLEERDRAYRTRSELEEMLREASMAASDAVREARLWQERNDALERDARQNLDDAGDALAQKARAEAEAAEAVWALTRVEAERTMYRAELAMLRQQTVQAAAQPIDTGALDAAKAAKETAEVALGRTLEEAAKLTFQLEDLERELSSSGARLEKAEADREMLDRQRRVAVDGQKNADAARAHAVMESKALADRVNRLEFEQTALVRELEARENDVLRLEASLARAVAQASEPTAPVVTMVAVDHGDDAVLHATRRAFDDAEIERLRFERTVERESRLEAEEMVDALRAALSLARDRITALRTSANDQTDTLVLHAQLAAVDAARERAEAEAEQLREASVLLTQDVGVLVHEARFAASARVEDLEARLGLAHARLSDLEAERVEWIEARRRLEDDAAAERSEARAEQLADRLFDAKAALDNVENQRTILEACAAELEAQRDVARDKNRVLRAELEVAASASADTGERDALAREVEVLRAAQNAADLDRDRLLAEVESLGRARNDALAERSTLEGLLQALAEQQETVERDRNAIEAELTLLRDATDGHETVLTELGRERDKALVAREKLEADIRVVTTERDAARTELEDRARTLTEERTQLEAALEVAIEERDSARRYRAELGERLVTLQAATDNHATERDEARMLAAQADAELSDAIERLEGANTAKAELATKLSETEDELQAAAGATEALAAQQRELESARAAVEAARAQKVALEERLASVTDKQQKEAHRFTETTGERDTLRAVLDAARAEEQDLKARIKALETELSEVQQASHDRVSRLAHTAGERDGLKAELLELRGQLDAERSRAETAWQQAQALEEQRQSVEAELIAAKDAATDPTMLARANKRAGEAELRAEKAESSLTRISSDYDETKLLLAQLESDKSDAEAALIRREAQIEKERADAKRAGDKARHAEAFSKESETRARDLEAKRKKLESRALEAEGRAEHAERQRRLLELEVQQIEARLQARVEDAEARATSLTDQRAELETARHRADSRVTELERELTGKSRGDLEASLHAATQRLAELESSSSTSVDAEALRGRVRNLERAVADRDGEMKRLRTVADRAARELDEARAEVGRKLSEIRQGREGLEFVRRQLAQARTDSDALRTRLDKSGDPTSLREQLDSRDQQIAQLGSESTALATERHRLQALVSSSEAAQVQFERRITELEMGLEDRDRRLERLTRELADKTERLRRLSGLSET